MARWPEFNVRYNWAKEEIPLKEKDVALHTGGQCSQRKTEVRKIITKTFYRKHERIRTLRLHTKRRMINRPVRKLDSLEENTEEKVCNHIFPPLDATEVELKRWKTPRSPKVQESLIREKPSRGKNCEKSNKTSVYQIKFPLCFQNLHLWFS